MVGEGKGMRMQVMNEILIIRIPVAEQRLRNHWRNSYYEHIVINDDLRTITCNICRNSMVMNAINTQHDANTFVLTHAYCGDRNKIH